MSKNHHEIKSVWIAKDYKVIKELKKKNMRVVRFGSLKSMIYLFRAGVVLTSSGVADLGPVRLYGGAFQAELWHGMPITRVFHDKPEFKKNKTLSFLYNLKEMISEGKPDMIVSTSEQTKRCLSSAFRNNNVKITGQPRYKGMFKKDAKKQVLGCVAPDMPKDTKIISYVPTFRNPFTPESFLFSRKDWKEKEMHKILEKNKAIIMMKMHFYGKDATSDARSDRIIFKNDIEIQELLGATDILVTDYSSCFIDFLLLDRPIIFTPFDLKNHLKKRGLYYDYENVTPGPKIRSFSSFKKEVETYLKNKEKDKEKRKKINKMLNEGSGKEDSKRVYETIKTLVGGL